MRQNKPDVTFWRATNLEIASKEEATLSRPQTTLYLGCLNQNVTLMLRRNGFSSSENFQLSLVSYIRGFYFSFSQNHDSQRKSTTTKNRQQPSRKNFPENFYQEANNSFNLNTFSDPKFLTPFLEKEEGFI